MAAEFAFSEEEMAVSDTLGYPKAFAKLCRDRSVSPYCYGPPYTFVPYALQHNEAMREMEFDKLFPILNPKAKATAKPKLFVSLLWKQLNHLGNAGFDPAVIRVDPYGNVVYYHADPASPLYWDIDHWFPCSRGGLTVASNLRILQWQVRKRKHNKLEFLIPWWDLQLGISVNQFLSIFASSKSDFRHRAFSFLFSEGESEELNESQTVDSHIFPQHYIELKEQVGLAPAAIVVSRRDSYDTSSALKSLSYNRQLRPQSPAIARNVKPTFLKENENPNLVTNPYQALVIARDSMKQREEYSKMQTEIQRLDDEVNELKQKNEEEKLTIQDLELVLIKRRRRAEKCRRLAEAQSSYRNMLEKMIRDAMHQSVVYKEQVRLNQAASNALVARLEAQKAICDASERELRNKHKQRDELEKQIRHDLGHARKRSRMEDSLFEEPVLCLPGIKPLHKELRVFLEEEHKASEADLLSPTEEQKQEEIEAELQKSAKKNPTKEKCEEHTNCIIALEDEIAIEHNLQRLQIGEIGESSKLETQFPNRQKPEKEEDETSRQQRGKGNVEKWLHMLLENGPEDLDSNEAYVKKKEEIGERKGVEVSEKSNVNRVGIGSRRSFEGRERKEKNGKEIARSESARILRRIPSSPSIILSMRKGVDCMRKKPIVTSDEDGDEDHVSGNKFMKSWSRHSRK